MARLPRRALLSLTALPSPALAQGYPSRPIRLVVPFPAGGAVDAWARLVAEGMGPRLGQPCIVDNRPGAAGMLGAEAVARAAPDGHTLLFTIDALIQAPIILRRAPYDALRDFTPIGRLGATTLTLTVGDAVPAQVGSFAAFLAWARARPRGEPLLLGNWGMGGTGHVLGLLLAQELDLAVTHIGYRGEPPMVSDMLAGRFHGGFVTTLTFGEMIRAGRLRALASAGQHRVPSLADRVPTLQEFGLLQGFDYRAFSGLLAPAGLAPQRLAVLEQAFREVATSEAMARALHALDTIPGYAGPAEFGAAMAENAARWARLAERFALYQDGA
jgi:tripartite-type tricarboxylate transporter receptor subunit TctC